MADPTCMIPVSSKGYSKARARAALQSCLIDAVSRPNIATVSPSKHRQVPRSSQHPWVDARPSPTRHDTPSSRDPDMRLPSYRKSSCFRIKETLCTRVIAEGLSSQSFSRRTATNQAAGVRLSARDASPRAARPDASEPFQGAPSAGHVHARSMSPSSPPPHDAPCGEPCRPSESRPS